MLHKCKDCAYSIFDKVWGEYKCKVKSHRIYNVDEASNCEDYKKDVTKKESKSNENQ